MTLPGVPEKEVTATAARERNPFAITVGGQVLFSGTKTWAIPGSSFAMTSRPTPSSQATTLSTTSGFATRLHAARDSTDTVWAAFRTTGLSDVMWYRPPRRAARPEERLGSEGPPPSPEAVDEQPFVVVDHSDNVWVFWRSGAVGGFRIWYRRFLHASR